MWPFGAEELCPGLSRLREVRLVASEHKLPLGPSRPRSGQPEGRLRRRLAVGGAGEPGPELAWAVGAGSTAESGEPGPPVALDENILQQLWLGVFPKHESELP